MPRGTTAALLAAAGGAAFSRRIGDQAAKGLLHYTNNKTSRRTPYKHRNPKGVRTDNRVAIAKRHEASYLNSLRSGNTLTTLMLDSVLQGDAIDQRDRQVIYARGIRLMWFIKNQTSDPMLCNWAVIRMKFSDGTPILSEINANFFRGHQTDRATDFDAVGTALRKHQYGVNTDKYDVFAQGKFNLAPKDDASGYISGNLPSWKKIEEYVPINRKVYYDDDAAGSTNPLMFVSWVNPWDVETTAGTSNQQSTSFEATLYFQECV